MIFCFQPKFFSVIIQLHESQLSRVRIVKQSLKTFSNTKQREKNVVLLKQASNKMDENENLYIRTRSSGSMLNLKRLIPTIKQQISWLGVFLFAYDAVRVTHRDPALEGVTFYCTKASGLISLSIYLKKTINLLHPIMTKLD